MQTKASANTRETEWMPSGNPLGDESNITPLAASPESLGSATDFNAPTNQPSPETSRSDPSPLGLTLSPHSPTQSLITVNMYSDSTSNQKSLDPLLDNLIALTISFKQVDPGIQRFLLAPTGSINSPSDGIDSYLEKRKQVRLFSSRHLGRAACNLAISLNRK